MTYTGIISVKKGIGEYTVRIPELNKTREAIGATPENELYTARVVSECGIWPEYKSGDKVFVSFLTFGSGSPIILGLQYNTSARDRYSSAHFTDLEVTVNSTLPEDTTIGIVNPENIRCLKGLTHNVQTKFEEIDKLDVLQTASIKVLDATTSTLAERLDTAEEIIDTHTDDISSLESSLSSTRSTLTKHINSSLTHVSTQDRLDWDWVYARVRNNEISITDIKDREPIILTDASYGSELPSVTGPNAPKEGQLYFVVSSTT